MDISIVVPVYNEQDNVEAVYTAISSALRAMGCSYEIVMVDDGSSDGSYRLLTRLASEDSALKVIRFRRNFGQTAAMSAGFDFAKGDIIIPMDGDLQNDPADIPRLIEKINEGFDVVSGWRSDRKDTFITRKIPSLLANALISRMTGVHLHDYGCTLKAYRR
ncbi:MAG: glycosyltransferase family 2 protein, partial [Desulfuromonadaceae bacterium]